MSDDLPTPRSTLQSPLRVWVWCKACHRQAFADLQKLVDSGRGDVPLIKLRYLCSHCDSSQSTDWVVTSGYAPQPVAGRAGAAGAERVSDGQGRGDTEGTLRQRAPRRHLLRH
jgi:hypothetical protein